MKGKTNPVLFVFFVSMLFLGIVSLTGCSVAKGQDLPVRADALNAARTYGFDYDDTLISTVYGESQNQIVLTGPMVGPVNLDVHDLSQGKAEYTQVVLELINDAWVFSSATLK